MVAMLNVTDKDDSFTELRGDNEEGEAIPRQYLNIDAIDRMDGFTFGFFC
jgi:hypothetical protein